MVRRYKMNKANRLNKGVFPVLISCSLLLLVSSCASEVSRSQGAGEQSDSTTIDQAKSQNTQVASIDGASAARVQVQSDASVPPQSDKHSPITGDCKQQPYVRYQKQAHNYIKKGWEATQNQRFGVGFRDAEEYKRWSDTSAQLFTTVSKLCDAMNQCAKRSKTDKDKRCAAQVQQFKQWQDLAQQFVAKVKTVERAQPPRLCSLNPSSDDSSQCFDLLADQIDNTCQTEQCQEASACFRGVYILDDAINQARLACSYVGQKLSECRSYVEETARRKAEFQRCLKKYEQLPVEILPVI
jgi:hypothetical protein